jgi:beta-lactam-binding protein with PASTA domain
VGICLLIAGSVGGFVVMYLYTTIRIRELLEESATDLDSVPPLGKLSLGEAQQVMSTKGLKMTVDGPIGPDAVVLDQSPKPGDTVRVGTAVRVTVGASKNDGGEIVQAVPVPRPSICESERRGNGTGSERRGSRHARRRRRSRVLIISGRGQWAGERSEEMTMTTPATASAPPTNTGSVTRSPRSSHPRITATTGLT